MTTTKSAKTKITRVGFVDEESGVHGWGFDCRGTDIPALQFDLVTTKLCPNSAKPTLIAGYTIEELQKISKRVIMTNEQLELLRTYVQAEIELALTRRDDDGQSHHDDVGDARRAAERAFDELRANSESEAK